MESLEPLGYSLVAVQRTLSPEMEKQTDEAAGKGRSVTGQEGGENQSMQVRVH